MTEEEYKTKREQYMTSSASKETIQNAIEMLDASYEALSSNKHKKLLEDIEESRADIDDINS